VWCVQSRTANQITAAMVTVTTGDVARESEGGNSQARKVRRSLALILTVRR